jgi:FkbH-like protein
MTVVKHQNIRQELISQLKGVLGVEPGIAVIHSSLAELVPSSKISAWDVLYAIGRLSSKGWTIALPSFTFSFCGGKAFDKDKSPSEVGILADWMLNHFPEAVRTNHPIYSFVVLGPKSKQIVECISETTFGVGSPFELFERENATIVMMGCGWKYCTQFHRYEELAKVPYRYNKEFTGISRTGNDEKSVTAAMFVRDFDLDPVNDFSSAVKEMENQGSIQHAPLWRGKVQSVQAKILANVCKRLLEENPLVFVKNSDSVARKMHQKREALEQEPVKVAVLGSSNVEFLKNALLQKLSKLLPERRVNIFTVPFGQMYQEVISPKSELRKIKPTITVFCERLEDIAGSNFEDEQQVEDCVYEYGQLIATYCQENEGIIIVHQLAPRTRNNCVAGAALAVMTQKFNQILQESLADCERVVWLDMSQEFALAEDSIIDERLWYLGRFPFSNAFSDQLADRWAAITLAELGKTVRLVVVDLDNTMWGGVVGEEGIDGIHVGGDYPGNAFIAFQRSLKALSNRGIALAICSKNDEDLALQAIDTHPEMVLRSSDFIAHRINWNPKWVNIRELADDVNLGLDSILFIDDNPVEREAVRRNLQGVKILELPADPAGYDLALRRSPWLEVVRILDEDKKRVENYKARNRVKKARQQSASIEDFWNGLGMILRFRSLDDGNIERAVQLCQKTNQFNTTTKRYSKQSLREITTQGGEVIVIGLSDKYTEMENIGLIILKPEGDRKEVYVDSYMLSCRVLGKDVETMVLKWAIGHVAQQGVSRLIGHIIETPRNTPARNVFANAGFLQSDTGGQWHIDTSISLNLPDWFDIQDEVVTAQVNGDMR